MTNFSYIGSTVNKFVLIGEASVINYTSAYYKSRRVPRLKFVLAEDLARFGESKQVWGNLNSNKEQFEAISD
jgi:hypothetical protein